MRCWSGPAIVTVLLVHCAGAAAAQMQHSVLDRVASAVDGAESSHGEDPAMWRPDPSGPQGPMQVGAAAATDVGGDGDRFDLAENRAIGRAYLEQLYRRYHSWPDAIAAYNWGIGRVNAWLAAGRPAAKLAKGVAAYTDRVLRDSGLCAAAQQPAGQFAKPRFAARWRGKTRGLARSANDRFGPLACAEFAGAGAAAAGIGNARWRNDNRLLVGLVPDGFYRQLEDAINRTAQDLRAVEQQ
jgi:Transglycosylase SLT domain